MPQKIIIDTDPGVDDVLAILLGLSSPEVDLALISIVFGNTHAPIAHSNLLKIYHLLAQEVVQIPGAEARYQRLKSQSKTVLALGEDGPISGEKAVAAYFHGPDGLSNISETHPQFTPPEFKSGAIHDHLEISSKPSHEVILDILCEEPEDSVTIVALGPLTNIAHALRSNAKTFFKVSRIIWMGGAFNRPGNVSPVAEFNCFADPYAAATVLDAVRAGQIEMIMAPLDITIPHLIPFSDLIHPSVVPIPDTNGLVKQKPEPTPLEAFISAMLVRVRGLQASFGLPDAMEMHDPVAVWFAIAHASTRRLSPPAPGWTLTPQEFQIERNGEFTRGMCVVDRRGTGETGVDRSKNDKILSQGLTNDDSLPSKNEEVDRMDEQLPTNKPLPLVITQTPGVSELRRLLLSRVFGTQP
ncbi:hypothetical protein L204_103580 [Cryptococcus depauperatus]